MLFSLVKDNAVQEHEALIFLVQKKNGNISWEMAEDAIFTSV